MSCTEFLSFYLRNHLTVRATFKLILQFVKPDIGKLLTRIMCVVGFTVLKISNAVF